MSKPKSALKERISASSISDWLVATYSPIGGHSKWNGFTLVITTKFSKKDIYEAALELSDSDWEHNPKMTINKDGSVTLSGQLY